MEILRNQNDGKFRMVRLTENEFRMMTNEYEGLCVSCDNIRGECEPDARKYQCYDCEKNSVYAIVELLIMGRVAII